MIFRKVALERLSSPEQLDQLMQVTSPRGWLALGAFGALLLTALGWSVLGSIPTDATGEGGSDDGEGCGQPGGWALIGRTPPRQRCRVGLSVARRRRLAAAPVPPG